MKAATDSKARAFPLSLVERGIKGVWGVAGGTMPSWRASTGDASQRDFARANAGKERLRREPNSSEKLLWQELRLLNREGAKFRRQPAIGPWVFDFGYLSAKVLIELDGGVHEVVPEVAERDAEKACWAEANGYRLLRISNRELWDRRDVVLARVRAAISAPHPLPPLHKGEGESQSEH